MYQIKNSPFPILPRERLYLLGAKKLSNVELLGIILRTGTKKDSATQLADKLLSNFENLTQFEQASIEELVQQPGIGVIKAIEIKAMIELGKRVYQAVDVKEKQITSSYALAKELMLELGKCQQEHLVTIFLDNKNKVIKKKTIFIGSLNQSIAHPREILFYAIKFMSASIIIAHNHPSGCVTPSQEDCNFTQRLKESCLVVGINIIDHLIIGQTDYYSFKEHDKI